MPTAAKYSPARRHAALQAMHAENEKLAAMLLWAREQKQSLVKTRGNSDVSHGNKVVSQPRSPSVPRPITVGHQVSWLQRELDSCQWRVPAEAAVVDAAPTVPTVAAVEQVTNDDVLDERAEAEAFQQALREWRSGREKSQQFQTAATTTTTATAPISIQTMAKVKLDLHIESSLSYFDRLLLQQARRLAGDEQ